MQFETFRGRNVQEALAAVKAALGPNALIESTRHVSNGTHGWLGNTFVEVTAAPGADRRSTPPRRGLNGFSKDLFKSSEKPPEVLPPSPAYRAPRELAPSSSRGPQSSSKPSKQPTDPAVDQELRNIRTLLEEITTSRKPRDRAMSILHSAGIEGPLASCLAYDAGDAPKDPLELRVWLRERIAEQVTIMKSPLEQPGPRLIAVVGPTGVGKTTTVAKLAARAALELGRNVSVITLDTYRVGAVEQMRRFVELIGVPLDVARDRQSFNQALLARRSDIVLVDTAGATSPNSGAIERLRDCIGAVEHRAIDVLLAVPASIRSRDVSRLVKLYTDPARTGIIVTKLDETDQAGGAIHAAADGPLPVAYLCNGPRVPEDIKDATHEALLDAVLPVVK